MNRTLCALVATLLLALGAHADELATFSGYPQILVETTHGEFVLELDPRRAPLTARQFLTLVNEGFYTDTIFHRVIAGFVAQGGGHTRDFAEKGGVQTLVNESGNGLSNQRGTVAMARGNDPHSATNQFYINLADNSRLDPNTSRWGYAVFGQVVSGMDTIDRIAALPTGPGGPFASDVPAVPVVVTAMRRLTNDEIAARAQAELEAAEAALEALKDEM